MQIGTKVDKFLNEIEKLLDKNQKIYVINLRDIDYKERLKVKENDKFYITDEYHRDVHEWGNYVTTKPQKFPTLIVSKDLKRYYRSAEKDVGDIYVLILDERDISEDKKHLLTEYKKDNELFKHFNEHSLNHYGKVPDLFLEKIMADPNYKFPSFINIGYDDIKYLLKTVSFDRIVSLIAASSKNSFSLINNRDESYIKEIFDYFKTKESDEDNNKIYNILLKYSSVLKGKEVLVEQWFNRVTDEQKEKLYDLYPSQEIKNTVINYGDCIGDNETYPVFAFHWKSENFLNIISKDSYKEMYDARDMIMRAAFDLNGYKVTHIANMGKSNGSSEFMFCGRKVKQNVETLTMEKFKDSVARLLSRFVSKPNDRSDFSNLNIISQEILNQKEKEYLNSVVKEAQVENKKLKY